MDTLYEATQREYSLLPPKPELHMTIKRTLLFVVLVLCPWPAWAETATVYFNGDILTMEGDSPPKHPPCANKACKYARKTSELPVIVALA
jgi:hypothetical protein